MTVDRELLATRIAKIRVELRHLARLETVPREQFLASSIEQHAVERELQIVIEACLDIGHHVISREGGYLDLEPGRVYEMARNELGDVEAFVATIVTRYVPGTGS